MLLCPGLKTKENAKYVYCPPRWDIVQAGSRSQVQRERGADDQTVAADMDQIRELLGDTNDRAVASKRDEPADQADKSCGCVRGRASHKIEVK